MSQPVYTDNYHPPSSTLLLHPPPPDESLTSAAVSLGGDAAARVHYSLTQRSGADQLGCY